VGRSPFRCSTTVTVVPAESVTGGQTHAAGCRRSGFNVKFQYLGDRPRPSGAGNSNTHHRAGPRSARVITPLATASIMRGQADGGTFASGMATGAYLG